MLKDFVHVSESQHNDHNYKNPEYTVAAHNVRNSECIGPAVI